MQNLLEITYDGLNIKEYCQLNNIDFNYLKYKLKTFQKKKEGYLPLEIQVKLAVSSYFVRNKYTKIMYKGMTLLEYCQKYDITYAKIAWRCKYYAKNNHGISSLNEEQINLFIEDYYKKEEILKLKDVFETLDNNSKCDYKLICQKLNINYAKVKQLQMKTDLDFRSLIYINWYSSDKNNNQGIYISNKRLNEVLTNKDMQLNDLYGIYKSGKKEYLNAIFENEKSYLIGFIFKQVREYNFIIYPSDYDDLLAQAQFILTSCISRNVFNQMGKIIRYIEVSVKKQILKYLIKNYTKKYLVFDDTRFAKQFLKWEY